MLLKEVFNHQFLQKLAASFLAVDVDFDVQKFLRNFEENWHQKELKQRMRAVALAVFGALGDKEFAQKIDALKNVAQNIAKDKNSNLALIFLCDFVEVFGLEHFDLSMNALEFLTQFGSAEFAVRQFIKLDEARALKFFVKWSKSQNYHVRRLASEGCRPRLPWGEALQNFKKNPAPILLILENLKFDESVYVQKSVANNLNDISKDNSDLVLDLLQKWQHEKVSQSLIKHALRGLLKKGDKTALKIIGVEVENLSKNFNIQSFALEKAVLNISQVLNFSFVLENKASNNKIRLEYVVYFLLKNGSYGKKNFQITTKNFAKGVFSFTKKHAFFDLSTRKHNVGKHLISLIVNGVEIQKLQFDLIKK